MSYCRFENTYKDLRDCQEYLEDDLTNTEKKYRQRLIDLCSDIAQDYGDNE